MPTQVTLTETKVFNHPSDDPLAAKTDAMAGDTKAVLQRITSNQSTMQVSTTKIATLGKPLPLTPKPAQPSA